ncbi:hypothetical protein CLF_109229 [Clonorchis sinensis]|uniref:Uncharacterized protein n=1 Tax=Clonorchis sinensis TaxID=79923 RepID=G7YJ32_CLOSI|nr:hypothetical protein CLF_109229 [Clonorchis sinensis]
MHGEKGPEDITRIDAKKDLGIWLSPNLSFSLHLEKSAQKAFAVLRMIRRTFSRITRMDFQIPYAACVRPLLEYATPLVYSGRTKDVIPSERQPLKDKNKTDPGNLGESLYPVYQSVKSMNARHRKGVTSGDHISFLPSGVEMALYIRQRVTFGPMDRIIGTANQFVTCHLQFRLWAFNRKVTCEYRAQFSLGSIRMYIFNQTSSCSRSCDAFWTCYTTEYRLPK